MNFEYKVFAGETIIVEGVMVATDISHATSVAMKKVSPNIFGLKIEINGKQTFPLNKDDRKIFARPYAKKLQGKPERPW